MKAELQQELPDEVRLKRNLRRDFVGLVSTVVVAGALVFFFDTGAIAQWIADHKHSKVDEIIVIGFILLVGLGVFSIFRWMELHRQVIKYGELHGRMIKLSRESALLGDLSDMLQSCLSSDEAHKLITDRAKVLFPGSCGAVCVIANSRDIVEVVATWGEPSFSERFFAPKDCWALRRGRVHVLGDDSAGDHAHRRRAKIPGKEARPIQEDMPQLQG